MCSKPVTLTGLCDCPGTRIRAGDLVEDPNNRYFGRCEDVGQVEYLLEDAFSARECLVPNNRRGILVGMTRANSTTDAREKPVFRFDGKFKCSVARISAGGHHTCLIYGDEGCTNCNTGYTECFGWNDYNQSTVPQCFDGGQPKVAAHDPDLTGLNGNELEKGMTMEEDEKPQLLCKYSRPPLQFKEISAGLFHTCAVTTWGEAVCWGDNRSGQLSNLVPGEYTYPTQIKFKKVCAGAYHSCGVLASFPNTGQVDCW